LRGGLVIELAGIRNSKLLYLLLESIDIVVEGEVGDSHNQAEEEAVRSFEVCRQLDFDACNGRAAKYG
jgi:hypothetical protein